MRPPAFSVFLESKPLYYDEIDHERVHRAYADLRVAIREPKVVHIVGTNGKGSTGRMIAHLAFKSGIQVGHFSSPHILKFNERIWVNGIDSSDEVLESAHQKLYKILGQKQSDALSYFEYTTLLALVVFEKLDLVILEAGLGGEYDATNVCDKVLSVITPIGIDHQAFLGETIEEIAATKIRSIQKKVLLAPQLYHEVLEVAQRIAKDKKAILYQQKYPHSDNIRAHGIPKIKGWSDYLVDNAEVAMQALEILDIAFDVNDFLSLELFGRFYPLTRNIRIDVGHNPLAAKAIVKAIKEDTVLIYNSLDDKDYGQVLGILKPKLKRVEIIPITNQRAVTTKKIEEVLVEMDMPYSVFDGSINRDENYLVFGSFYTVEAFLNALDQ